MAAKATWDKKAQKLERKGLRTIGERLKVLRYKAGKSIHEVCRETGIVYPTLYRWEADNNMPMLRELIIIAEYYGASLDYIVLGRK